MRLRLLESLPCALHELEVVKEDADRRLQLVQVELLKQQVLVLRLRHKITPCFWETWAKLVAPATGSALTVSIMRLLGKSEQTKQSI